jgi:hypothetical protein
VCERTTLENKLANHNKTTSITRVDIAIMKTPKAGKHAPVCEVFTTSLVSETIGTFCWDITGIGLWWNDRFIGAQNRLRRNFSFR